MAGKPYETNRGNNQDDDASGCDPAEDVKSLQPRIDGVAQKHDIFQAATKCNHGNKNEEQLAKADDTREKVQSAVGFGGEERPLISLANNEGDRPEQNGQKHERSEERRVGKERR